MKTRMITRYILMAIGAIGLLGYIATAHESVTLSVAAVVALFLGATDFGRQCPLWLSVQHQVARYKLRKAAREKATS